MNLRKVLSAVILSTTFFSQISYAESVNYKFDKSPDYRDDSETRKNAREFLESIVLAKLKIKENVKDIKIYSDNPHENANIKHNGIKIGIRPLKEMIYVNVKNIGINEVSFGNFRAELFSNQEYKLNFTASLYDYKTRKKDISFQLTGDYNNQSNAKEKKLMLGLTYTF